MKVIIINGSPRKRSPLPLLKHKVILSFGIKPFVRKKGRKYQGVIDKWKELGIYG